MKAGLLIAMDGVLGISQYGLALKMQVGIQTVVQLCSSWVAKKISSLDSGRGNFQTQMSSPLNCGVNH